MYRRCPRGSLRGKCLYRQTGKVYTACVFDVFFVGGVCIRESGRCPHPLYRRCPHGSLRGSTCTGRCPAEGRGHRVVTGFRTLEAGGECFLGCAPPPPPLSVLLPRRDTNRHDCSLRRRRARRLRPSGEAALRNRPRAPRTDATSVSTPRPSTPDPGPSSTRPVPPLRPSGRQTSWPRPSAPRTPDPRRRRTRSGGRHQPPEVRCEGPLPPDGPVRGHFSPEARCGSLLHLECPVQGPSSPEGPMGGGVLPRRPGVGALFPSRVRYGRPLPPEARCGSPLHLECQVQDPLSPEGPVRGNFPPKPGERILPPRGRGLDQS